MEDFELQLLSINWIKGEDDPQDLCAHGAVRVRIGSEILVDSPDGDGWTVSAAALHLMRTAIADYKPGDFAGQLIPCCGFSMYASEAPWPVDIIGCPSGFDWHVKHLSGTVVLQSLSGSSAELPLTSYKTDIRAFADQVSDFYRESTPKKLPDDDVDRAGYEAFLNEWKELRLRLDDRA